VQGAIEDAIKKIRAVVGSEADVALARPDAAGRLRVVWRDGTRTGRHRDRSAQRRTAFETLRPILASLDHDHAIGTVPLVAGTGATGVLEVVACEAALAPAWDLVQLIAGQLALTAQSISQREQLRREAQTLERASVLGGRLVRAATIEEATRMAVRFLAERFHVPVAGWCEGDDGVLTIASIGGLGTRRRDAVAESLGALVAPGADGLGPAARDTLAERFREVAGVPSASAPDAGAAVLVVGRHGRPIEGSLDAVASLLADVLRLVAAARAAATRREHLDMGLAWTAHELRRPLVGVRAALEAIGNRHESDPREAAMVSSSVRELDQLMGTTEALLGWAAGTQPLQREPEDLVEIVRDAVASCRLETGVTRIGIRIPRRAVASIDRTHVRTAIVNLLRNATAHADEGTEVEVRLREDAERITISVTDEGPQIPSDERTAIFEPFVRGHVSGRARNGSGLGLFIARRVVEAHDGAIWVDSGPHRTTFHISFPTEVLTHQEVERSAS
jgi:signal transduction histidine kinase